MSEDITDSRRSAKDESIEDEGENLIKEENSEWHKLAAYPEQDFTGSRGRADS